MSHKLLAASAAVLALGFASGAAAQVAPPAAATLTGPEKITCTQNNSPATCTLTQIKTYTASELVPTDITAALGYTPAHSGSNSDITSLNGPALGTPASATLTNATGLPLTSGVTGTLAPTNGGTGASSTSAFVNGQSAASALTGAEELLGTQGGGAVNVLTSALGKYAQGQVLVASATSGVDMGAQINALIAQLPTYNTGNGPTPFGTIKIPVGQWFYSTTINFSPLVAIEGQKAALYYTGSGNAFFCSDTPTSYSGWGGVYNLELFGTSSATAGIKLQECTFTSLREDRVAGFTNGIAVWLNDVTKWTEQSNFDSLRIDTSLVGIEATDQGTGGGVAYSRWRNIEISVPAGGTGVLLANDIAFTTDMEVKCFFGQNATCLHLENTASIVMSTVDLGGELNPGATAGNGMVLDSGTSFSANGGKRWWYTSGITDTFTTGSTYRWYDQCLYNTNECTVGAPNGFGIMNGGPNGYEAIISAVALTGPQTYTLPNLTGTFALTGAGQNVSFGGVSTSTSYTLQPVSPSAATSGSVDLIGQYRSASATLQCYLNVDQYAEWNAATCGVVGAYLSTSGPVLGNSISGVTPITSVGSLSTTTTGTGATVACASGVVCDNISGTLTLTTGTGSLSAGALFTVTWGQAKSNKPSCNVQIQGGTTGLFPTDAPTTAVDVISAGVALAASTTYQVKYNCGGK